MLSNEPVKSKHNLYPLKHYFLTIFKHSFFCVCFYLSSHKHINFIFPNIKIHFFAQNQICHQVEFNLEDFKKKYIIDSLTKTLLKYHVHLKSFFPPTALQFNFSQ